MPDELDVLVREVERGFEVGEQVQEVVAKGRERSGDAARQLREREPEVRVGPGRDDGVDRLGLRQVLLAGEEGAQRELARLGRPGAGAQKIGDEPFDQRRRADGVQFREVLPGVRPRAGEEVERRPGAGSGRRRG